MKQLFWLHLLKLCEHSEHLLPQTWGMANTFLQRKKLLPKLKPLLRTTMERTETRFLLALQAYQVSINQQINLPWIVACLRDA